MGKLWHPENTVIQNGRHLTPAQVLGAVNAKGSSKMFDINEIERLVSERMGAKKSGDEAKCREIDKNLFSIGVAVKESQHGMAWCFLNASADSLKEATNIANECDTGWTVTHPEPATAADPITTLRQARNARDEAELDYQQALTDVREALGEGFCLEETRPIAAAQRPECDMDDPANWREGDVFTPTDRAIKHSWWGAKIYSAKRVGTQLVVIDDDDDERSVRSMVENGWLEFHHRP